MRSVEAPRGIIPNPETYPYEYFTFVDVGLDEEVGDGYVAPVSTTKLVTYKKCRIEYLRKVWRFDFVSWKDKLGRAHILQAYEIRDRELLSEIKRKIEDLPAPGRAAGQLHTQFDAEILGVDASLGLTVESKIHTLYGWQLAPAGRSHEKTKGENEK